MNVLIVYAHEEPKSFNAALKDRDLSVELAVVGKVDVPPSTVVARR